MNNNAYVLPVRYNDGGDYPVYDAPQDDSARYLHRVRRQTPSPTPIPTLDASILEHIRQRAAAFRERAAARLAPIADGERVGSAWSQMGSNIERSPRPSLRERISTLAEPLVSMVRESFPMARSKRDTTGPMLRVKEYNPSNDQTRYSKYMNKHMARVELPAPEHHETDIKEMERAAHCHSCGTHLTSSMCSQCGAYQPQYVEFIEGKQVPFYLGAAQTEYNDEHQPMTDGPATRFIFDRYGHKYLENNGKLRLVRNQPNYAELADIMNQNRESLRQLNQSPGRLMPQPIHVAADLTKLVRDMAREPRQLDDAASKNQEKRSTAGPRSMYQGMPMQYDGHDGKLLVNMYDKSQMESTTDPKMSDEQQKHQESEMNTQQDTNTMEKSSQTAQNFAKKDKEFEVLSFNDYKGTSDAEIRRVLEYLHPKEQW